MHDYNSMTYAEGRALLKQSFELPAQLTAGLQSIKDFAGKHMADAAASGAGQWAQKNLWENPVARNAIIGTVGGAGLGGLSSLWQDPEERSPVSRALTGGILGGLGGAGLGLWQDSKSENQVGADAMKELVHNRRTITDAARNGVPAAGAEASTPSEPAKPAMSQEEIDKAVGPALTPLQRHNEAYMKLDPQTGNPVPGKDIAKGLQGTIKDLTLGTPLAIADNVANDRPSRTQDYAQVGAQIGLPAGLHLEAKRNPTGRAARLLNGPSQLTAEGTSAVREALALHPELSQPEALKLLESAKPLAQVDRQGRGWKNLWLQPKPGAPAPTSRIGRAVNWARNKLPDTVKAMPATSGGSAGRILESLGSKETGLVKKLGEPSASVLRTMPKGSLLRRGIVTGVAGFAPALANRAADQLFTGPDDIAKQQQAADMDNYLKQNPAAE